jgi:hypothetical protein
MTFNPEIKLGPLTSAMCDSASWKGQDDFPSSQLWADEAEKILSFLQVHGQFERYLPRLKGKITQRDGALAEARVAFFFHRNGFSILSWEPKGASNRFGEFEIQWKNARPIFVEVKGPRWEGELEDNEKFGPRRSQPRYLNAEARCVNPVEKVISAAEKAVPKFLSDRPNLLVVTGYLLFLSPSELPRDIVEPQISHALSDQNFSRAGGIMIFDTHYSSKSIAYQIVFVENPNAEPLCVIPGDVAKGLSAVNQNSFWR